MYSNGVAKLTRMLVQGQILVLVAFCVIVISAKPQDGILTPEQELEAARRAQYSFSTDVNDEYSDLTQQRQETRNGLNVQGFYSYSDGYLKRKVTYEADEGGYRILSDEVEGLPGPKVNPDGVVMVNTQVDGSELKYSFQYKPPADRTVSLKKQ